LVHVEQVGRSPAHRVLRLRQVRHLGGPGGQRWEQAGRRLSGSGKAISSRGRPRRSRTLVAMPNKDGGAKCGGAEVRTRADSRGIDPPPLGGRLALVVDEADLLGRRQGSVDQGRHCEEALALHSDIMMGSGSDWGWVDPEGRLRRVCGGGGGCGGGSRLLLAVVFSPGTTRRISCAVVGEDCGRGVTGGASSWPIWSGGDD